MPRLLEMDPSRVRQEFIPTQDNASVEASRTSKSIGSAGPAFFATLTKITRLPEMATVFVEVISVERVADHAHCTEQLSDADIDE